MTDHKKLSERMSLQDYWAITEEDHSPLKFSSPHKHQSSRSGNRVQKATVSPHALWHVVAHPESDASITRDKSVRRKRPPRREYIQSQSLPRVLAQTAANRPTPHHKMLRAHRSPTRSGLKPMLVLCACSVMIVFGVIFVLTSPTFRIQQINVTGVHDKMINQRIQHLNILNQNIFLLDVAGLTQRIDALPQVATSQLSKQWPNGVSIHIVERAPVLLWQTTQGTYSVDAHGVVIASISDPPTVSNVNTVIDLTPSKHMAKLHPSMQLNQETIAFASNVLKLLPQMIDISNFKLYYNGTMYTGGIRQWEGEAKRGSFILESPGSWEAYLGGPDDTNPLSNKLIELHAILALAQRQQLNVATIDLRYGVHPVFTLKST